MLLALGTVLLLTGCAAKEIPGETRDLEGANVSVYAGTASNLEDEEIVFSFITNSQKKMILSYSEEQDRLIYRFFNKEALEIQLPADGEDSWSYFQFEDYHQAGESGTAVDVNHLVFVNAGYRYEIYDDYPADSGKRQVGVRVTSLTDSKSYDIAGDGDSAVGTLALLYEKYPALTHAVLYQQP